MIISDLEYLEVASQVNELRGEKGKRRKGGGEPAGNGLWGLTLVGYTSQSLGAGENSITLQNTEFLNTAPPVGPAQTGIKVNYLSATNVSDPMLLASLINGFDG